MDLKKHLNIFLCIYCSVTFASNTVSISVKEHLPIQALLSQGQVQDKRIALRVTKRVTLENGQKKVKISEFYKDTPVLGYSVHATQQHGEFHHIEGRLLDNITPDLPDISKILTKVQILTFFKKHLSLLETEHTENEKIDRYVLPDNNNRARYVYLVSLLIDTPSMRRPFAIMNALDGKILHSWEGLTTDRFTKLASGPGGNQKVGKFTYTKQAYGLIISKDCKMSSKNVLTYDMKNKTVGGQIFEFDTCPEKGANNDYKLSNGAYSPLNDAHAFAENVYKMFHEWYQIPPLEERIKLQVHYGEEVPEATWNGKEISLGDGNTLYYPVIAPDIVAHEIAHGFTEHNAGLLYANQSGAINESFSDITGEAAKYFYTKTNKYPLWLYGESVVKGERGKAIRYFDDPTRDGKSIKHADDYTDGMDVHYSSGVFNHAFYLLSHKPGWDIKKAYDLFILANQIAWGPTTSFNVGACSLARLAQDFNMPSEDVIHVFNEVGVNANCAGVPELERSIKDRQRIMGLSGEEGSQQFFYINVGPKKGYLRIRTESGTGDIDLYMRYEKHPTFNQHHCLSDKSGTVQQCDFTSVKPGKYYIMIHGYETFAGVTMAANTF